MRFGGRVRVQSGALLLAATLIGGVAFAAPSDELTMCVENELTYTSADHVPAVCLPPRSESVGYPWRGRLEHGKRLIESDHVRLVPSEAARGYLYGTEELVTLLHAVAGRVAESFPGFRMSVGELSKPEGGWIGGHNSHRNGRDADVGLYVVNQHGEPGLGERFVAINGAGDGRAWPYEQWRFHDAANWTLLRELSQATEAPVQHVFVSLGLQSRLINEARRQGESDEVIERARRMMRQPEAGSPHDNHFHVRIFCAPGDRPRCVDRGPFWSWYLASIGLPTEWGVDMAENSDLPALP